MLIKISGDEIPEMIEECLTTNHPNSTRAFLESLNAWYDERGYLTEKQYDNLVRIYDGPE